MKISALHIDGFGKFSGLSIEDLPPGLVVYKEANEAGKSTLFQSNTPLACCGDGKLPREPLIIIRFTNSVFGLLTFAQIKSY